MTIAIIGMACTVIPCLWYFVGPLIEKVAEWFVKFVDIVVTLLYKIASFILYNIIVPLVEFCHTWGLFEFLGYFLCFQFIAEGSRMDSNEMMGMNIALTGLFMQLPLFFYSTILHTKKMRTKKNPDAFLNLLLTWILLCYFPMTIQF